MGHFDFDFGHYYLGTFTVAGDKLSFTVLTLYNSEDPAVRHLQMNNSEISHVEFTARI